MLTFNEKFDYINTLREKTTPDENDWNEIEKLSSDESSEIRQLIGEVLALFPCDKSEELLLSMLHDKDYLVRTNVVDSLSFSKSQKTLRSLQELLSDKSVTVRGYAALSIGDIQRCIGGDIRKTVNMLRNSFFSEKSEWGKIAIASSLCLLGETQFSQALFSAVNSRYYKNRCFALNSLADLPGLYSNELLNLLRDRQKTENALCVKENLEKLIATVEGKILNEQIKN